MKRRRRLPLLWLALGLLILISLATALAAGNLVPSTAADRMQSGINANALKPAECAALNLTAVRSGSGTNGNDLLVGTAAGDSLSGGNGDDCILAGGGFDLIFGGSGYDVCLRGPGGGLAFSCEEVY